MTNKIYILTIALILLNVILISAYPVAEASKQPLDMVYLLVENTFGGIPITAIGMIVLFFLIGMWSKMNPLTIMYFCMLFLATFSIGWLGGVAAFPMGLFCIWYVWNSWKNFQNSGGGS
jgi:hypothetical protein